MRTNIIVRMAVVGIIVIGLSALILSACVRPANSRQVINPFAPEGGMVYQPYGEYIALGNYSDVLMIKGTDPENGTVCYIAVGYNKDTIAMQCFEE